MNENKLKGKRVLVTGGAGFIGSHIVDSLLERGAAIRVLDNFSTGKKENIAHCIKVIELIEGDIRNEEVCKKACSQVNYVFHEAALGSVPRSMKDPRTTIDVNVAGTAAVFSAARDAGVERVVFASSSSVYGDSERLPKKEGEEGRPLSPYAMSKVMNEEMAEVFRRCFSMKFIGLRYFNVYGSRQDPFGYYAAVIPRFFKAFLSGDAPVIYGDGVQTRDFTYVKDVIEANLLAMTADDAACGGNFNIAGGKPVSVNELAKAVSGLCGRADIVPRHEPPRPGDVMHSTADLTKAGLLNYHPKTTINEGLTNSFESYKKLFAEVK